MVEGRVVGGCCVVVGTAKMSGREWVSLLMPSALRVVCAICSWSRSGCSWSRSGCLVLVKGRVVCLVVVKAGVLSELLRAVGVVGGVRGSRSGVGEDSSGIRVIQLPWSWTFILFILFFLTQIKIHVNGPDYDFINRNHSIDIDF